MLEMFAKFFVQCTVASYDALLFELLLIDTHRNSTRTGLGLEVRACTASPPYVRKKSLFHKLIRMIRIIMLKIFVAMKYF